jgi:streptogramin lyase
MPDYVFENLGRPLKPKPAGIEFVTRDAGGRGIAWGTIESPDRRGVFGIDVETGKSTWIDTDAYGKTHIRIHKADENRVYIYAGDPGRFLRYDVWTGRLTDLGVPAEDTNYWLGQAVGPDGVLYVGSYPATHLVGVDPRTDETCSLGPVAEDPKEKYIVRAVVSDDNVIYCPVGLHHRELWSVDPKTGSTHQILTENLMKAQGAPSAWLGGDGAVYGQAGDTSFRCYPDRIEPCDPAPERSIPKDNRVGGHRATQLSEDGQLVLEHDGGGDEKRIDTDCQGAAVKVYSVSCEHLGKIYGGGFQPANTFEYDPQSRGLEDIGRLTTGTIQVYDILSHPKGLFLSSYMGANQDYYNPETGDRTSIATLSQGYEQERGQQLTIGPDGRIYTGTVPVKGHLGGAVVRLGPKDLSVVVWRNVVPNQSLISAVPVEATGEVFFTSSVQGGSSAIPTEKEAVIFLWDVEREEIGWQGVPIKGATAYGRAVMGRNGLIYGLAGSDRSEALFGRAGQAYYVIDPAAREVIHTGVLPVSSVRWPGMAPLPTGPDGLIVGLADDAVFAIDPADNSARVLARDPAIQGAQGMFATEEGELYFGSGASLMRVSLFASAE